MVSDYVTSVFLTHSKAENIFESVNKALDKISGSFVDVFNRLLQISMAVNHFTEDFLKNFSTSMGRNCSKQVHARYMSFVSGALQYGLKKVLGICQLYCKACTTFSKILLHAGLIIGHTYYRFNRIS